VWFKRSLKKGKMAFFFFFFFFFVAQLLFHFKEKHSFGSV
jgi:hypothetical protein